jgi:outer membrane protein assembly factor BamB
VSARRLALLAAIPLCAGLLATTQAPALGHSSAKHPNASGFGSNWTVYHGNSIGSGRDTAGTNLRPLHSAWASPVLDGSLFGEPLVYSGRVFAATENNTVYELAANTGKVIWSTHIAAPVPQGDLACSGDIGDVGITGTPVIDPARREIFVVVDELAGGSPSHHLVGINLFNGDIELNEAVNPPQSDPAAMLQRTGLTLSGSNVVFGFGGNDGDCGNYHGTIGSVPAAGGTPRYYVVDSAPNEREGAVWMGGGAPLVDPAGNIWFATGNGSQSGNPYDFSDSVTELAPSLARKQYFAPLGWGSDNATDADLGSAAPAFVDGYVFQVGKSHTAYLLNPRRLGGINGQLEQMPLCQQDPHGGLAVSGTTVYVGCGEGVAAVRISTSSPHMTVLWSTSSSPDGVSINGPPIVASGLVWSIDTDGTLWGLNPLNGNHVVSEQTNGGEQNHFPTPAVGDGLILVPTSNQVFAYDGPAGRPPPPPPVPGQTKYLVAAAGGGVYAFGGAPYHGSAGGLHLHKPIVGMATTPGGRGYWLVASDGGVFAFGNAHFHGSMGGHHLNRPIVGMAATRDGRGYWLVASDGGIFSFGDAHFQGSMGGRHLNRPIVAMAADPHHAGYWLVASDGGIFSFAAPFHGSTGSLRLKSPIAGMAADPRGVGYWLVAGDGGVFAFSAPYEGSLGGAAASTPVVAMAATPDGQGYWFVDRAGGVHGFGTALPVGGPPPSAAPITSIAAG